MALPPLHGVVPILITPFHADGSIDEESLANLVEFNIAAGVHGLGVALGSEVFKFNESERAQLTRCVIKAANKRVPIVINSGASGTDLAVFYSKAAEAAGADMLMVIPPTFNPASPQTARRKPSKPFASPWSLNQATTSRCMSWSTSAGCGPAPPGERRRRSRPWGPASSV